MASPWSSASEHVRWLAIQRLEVGERQEDVAEWFGVSIRTIQRWWRSWREEGPESLCPRPGAGRPCKLNERQVEKVLDWMDHEPSKFGFATERWTTPRVAWLIRRRFGVTMNHRYLNDWLRRHGVTPQMPQPQARERGDDDAVVQGWLRHQWPRIKKRPAICRPPLVLPMNAAFFWPR